MSDAEIIDEAEDYPITPKEHGVDFLLKTNAGNFRTDMTNDGFIKKNTMEWFSVNGPLDAGNWLTFSELPGKRYQYQLSYRKSRKQQEND